MLRLVTGNQKRAPRVLARAQAPLPCRETLNASSSDRFAQFEQLIAYQVNLVPE